MATAQQHTHGTCSACGAPAIRNPAMRWWHVGRPCGAVSWRRDGAVAEFVEDPS